VQRMGATYYGRGVERQRRLRAVRLASPSRGRRGRASRADN
jgi:hypothetical protein